MPRLPLQRKVTLGLAGGLVVLVADVVIGHVLGSSPLKGAQLVPIVYGALGVLVLSFAAFAPEAAFRRCMVTVGALGVLVGLAGLVLHGRAVADGLAGEPWTSRAVAEALSVGPPLVAPAAFVGLGALIALTPLLVRAG